MKQYLDFYDILETDKKSDRTGTGTISVFGYQFRHNLKKVSFAYDQESAFKIHYSRVALVY